MVFRLWDYVFERRKITECDRSNLCNRNLAKIGWCSLLRGGKKVRISVMPFTCGLFRLNSLFSLVT